MITTVRSLIDSLKNGYALDETISYTIYSRADVFCSVDRDFDDKDVDKAWGESIIYDVDSAIDTAQAEINEYLEQAIYRYEPEEAN